MPKPVKKGKRFEVTLSDNSVLEFDPEDKEIRLYDVHGNCNGKWEPCDPEYNNYVKYFEKRRKRKDGDVKLPLTVTVEVEGGVVQDVSVSDASGQDIEFVLDLQDRDVISDGEA